MKVDDTLLKSVRERVVFVITYASYIPTKDPSVRMPEEILVAENGVITCYPKGVGDTVFETIDVLCDAYQLDRETVADWGTRTWSNSFERVKSWCESSGW